MRGERERMRESERDRMRESERERERERERNRERESERETFSADRCACSKANCFMEEAQLSGTTENPKPETREGPLLWD